MSFAKLALCLGVLLETMTIVSGQCNYYTTPVVNGYSSWYNSWSSGGGCGNINQPIPTGLAADISCAINQVEFGTGKICGMCLRVTSVTPVPGNTDPNPFPPTPFIAYINDVCTTCITNQLDFYRVPQVGNNWNLNWQAVDCPVASNPIQMQFKDGTNPYYIIVVPIRQKVAVMNIEVLDGSTYTAMTKNTALNGQWEYQVTRTAAGIPTPTFRVTACTSEVLIDTYSITIPSGGLSTTTIATGTKNFAGYGSGTTAPPTTKPATTAPPPTTAPPTKPATTAPPPTTLPPTTKPATTAPPVTTAPPTTKPATTAPPPTPAPTTAPPATTPAPSTTAPPTTTAPPPTAAPTTAPPATTAPPSGTTAPPSTTKTPTTAPPSTTPPPATSPSTGTTAPPASTTAPPTSTTAPPTSTTAPPSGTTAPPGSSSPPSPTASPSPTDTSSPPSPTQPASTSNTTSPQPTAAPTPAPTRPPLCQLNVQTAGCIDATALIASTASPLGLSTSRFRVVSYGSCPDSSPSPVLVFTIDDGDCSLANQALPVVLAMTNNASSGVIGASVSTTPRSPSGSSKPFPIWAIVLIVVGAVILIAGVAVLVYIFVIKKAATSSPGYASRTEWGMSGATADLYSS